MKTIKYLFAGITMLLMIQPLSGQVPELGYINISSGGGKIYLSWQLLAGATCLGITVHRSSDDLLFQEIGKIEGVCGDLNQPQSYSFIDENPPLNQRLYYRLELGNGNFSETRFVDVIDLQGEPFQVRPNPVRSVSTIFFLNPGREMHSITITDLQGRIIYSQDTRNDRLPIRASFFAKGLYIFRLESSGGARSMTGKFLVLPQ